MSAQWRTTFQHKPIPELRESLGLVHTFRPEQFARMKAGHLSQEMEDKWDIGFEDGWLLICRSWTGYCVYGMSFDEQEDGVRITDAWVNRNTSEYKSQDVEDERKLLLKLLSFKLLNSEPL